MKDKSQMQLARELVQKAYDDVGEPSPDSAKEWGKALIDRLGWHYNEFKRDLEKGKDDDE
jgi:hypothetical protein